MTLFGQPLDAQQVFGVASLVAVLALWLIVLARHRGQKRHHGDKPDRKTPPAARGPWG
ncbi:hypothetical protein [Brevundimonas naejangsanensis]|uniref:hypothetical protein n=1 Tax=Brevundimonas naejangsanensis TaxID=588932 RepID=UPI0013C51DF9|nr:hypothetical protein [Brevundimonas naejangsanensis]